MVIKVGLTEKVVLEKDLKGVRKWAVGIWGRVFQAEGMASEDSA